MRKQNGSIKLIIGISVYAQINGRVCVSPEEKTNLDGHYYKHISLWLGIKIFVITILQTLHLKKYKPIEEQEGKQSFFSFNNGGWCVARVCL